MVPYANMKKSASCSSGGVIYSKEYWQNELATKDAFDGDWFKTGDLAKMDRDGDVFIVGRKRTLLFPEEKTSIRRKSNNALLNIQT